MLHLVVWLTVGGLIGWLTSSLFWKESGQGRLGKTVIGVVGALLAGIVLRPVVTMLADQSIWVLPSALIAALGALVMLGLVVTWNRIDSHSI